MENFLFAVNATVPLFLIIVLGFFLQKIHLFNDNFNKVANEFVFSCALPISLFRSIAGMDFYIDFDPLFCLFCFATTSAMFLIPWAVCACCMKDKRQVGAFAQASARSSAAILGVALAENIYGSAGLVPIMIMSAVPFFNIYSVLILNFSPQVDEKGYLMPALKGRSAVKQACINVLKNPVILGILIGVPFALLRLSVPPMIDSALKSVGSLAAPLALLVIGASFSGAEALTRWKSAVVSSFLKLLLIPAIFLPLAAALGFRQSALIAVLIMTGSPTTVAAFVMAKKMHADSVLTSNAVILSTAASALSITLWVYVLRCFGLV
ncbi:MAG: AEC family transporter [Eubacteriales bacterium]|nr:AEC family transporter [Eubacteriales bacterium]